MVERTLRIGADILFRAALSDEFQNASGQYYDNDAGNFSSPHADAMNENKVQALIQVLEEILNK